MSDNSVKILKILLVGDSSVGKTSIINKYTKNEFGEICDSTKGVDYKIKELVHNSIKYKLQIIDTAGQIRFHNITKNYFREADGIFIVFDLTDENTFQSLDYWINSIKEVVKSPRIIILGNKTDLIESINIIQEQINQYIDKTGYKIYKVSAKENHNIDIIFLLMIDLINDQPIPYRGSFYLKNGRNKKPKKKKF